MWSRVSPHDLPGKTIVESAVRRGDVAIDIGANFGLYTDRLARLVGQEGAVYAFEPHPSYADTLRRIAAARKNVTFNGSALSDRAGTAHLSVPAVGGRRVAALGSLEARSDGPETEIVDVSITTLQSALGDLANLRFIKCDVEGHEHEVLLGAQDLLVRHLPMLLIEIEQRHRARPVAETFDLLRDLGFDGHMLTPAGSRPLREFDLERDQLALIGDDSANPTLGRGYVNDFVFFKRGVDPPL